MSYSGSLGGIDAASALQVLGPARRSGLMTITSGDKSAFIVLDAGRVLFASCSLVPPLGSRLVAKGLVPEHVLNDLLSMQRRKKTRRLLGKLLVDLGLVPPHVARAEIEDHLVTVLREILSWGDEGTVHFDEADGETDAIVPPDEGDVDRLLLRAVAGDVED